jgi:hypothetical protein
VEWLKVKALSSNPSTSKKRKQDWQTFGIFPPFYSAKFFKKFMQTDQTKREKGIF